MDFEKPFIRAFLLVPIVALIGIIALFLKLSGTADPDIVCISVDSLGHVYIGKQSAIEVWENGEHIRTISPQTGRGYMFTITEEDTLLVAASSKNYRMSLDGTVLEQWDDPGADNYNEIQKSKYHCVSASGDSYELRESWWWSKVVKNDTEIVYQITPLAFTARIMQYISIISLICVVSYIVVGNLQEKIQDML